METVQQMCKALVIENFHQQQVLQVISAACKDEPEYVEGGAIVQIVLAVLARQKKRIAELEVARDGVIAKPM